MARVWVKPSRRAKGHWRSTGRRRASSARTAQVNKARIRRSRNTAAARRTIAPGSASVEMGMRHRINRARGVRDHPAMQRSGQIKNVMPRRRRRRRR